MPHASFWTDAERLASDVERQAQSSDSLSLFPHEPESANAEPVEVRPVPHDRVQLDPMLLTMQSRLNALEADLQQLRALASRVASEHRRIEQARLEAAHSLKVRQRVLRNEPPYVVQGDILTNEIDALAPPYGLGHRHHHRHQWSTRQLRANTGALVATMTPRPLRLRWPRVTAPEWMQTVPRHLGDYAAATGAFALLVIAALTVSPGEGVLGRDVPPVAAIARFESPVVPAPPVVLPARAPAPKVVPAAVTPDVVPAVRRQTAVERIPVFEGTLSVLSEPAGAAVFVNREYVGETPLQIPRVRAGSHVVWVEGEGYHRWTRGVLVPADKITKVSVNLERQQGGGGR